MVEIIFNFLVEEDAYKAFMSMSKFFQGSNVFKNNYVLINPIKKTIQENDKLYWSFILDISTGEDDITIEKTTTINGGQLDLINGSHKVWAFA